MSKTKRTANRNAGHTSQLNQREGLRNGDRKEMDSRLLPPTTDFEGRSRELGEKEILGFLMSDKNFERETTVRVGLTTGTLRHREEKPLN